MLNVGKFTLLNVLLRSTPPLRVTNEGSGWVVDLGGTNNMWISSDV